VGDAVQPERDGGRRGAAGQLQVWQQGRFYYGSRAASVLVAGPFLISLQCQFRYGGRAASVMAAGQLPL
jgi:hypothetical protein